LPDAPRALPGALDQDGQPQYVEAIQLFAAHALAARWYHTLISILDLIITVDTAVAHVASALGLPVWLLLPSVPDWRWVLDRADSPWDPTMRLFRQPSPGDWAGAVQQAAQALRELRKTCRCWSIDG
jgi:hypothetical protein